MCRYRTIAGIPKLETFRVPQIKSSELFYPNSWVWYRNNSSVGSLAVGRNLRPYGSTESRQAKFALRKRKSQSGGSQCAHINRYPIGVPQNSSGSQLMQLCLVQTGVHVVRNPLQSRLGRLVLAAWPSYSVTVVPTGSCTQ
jgi:hypothetical protein